MQEPAEKKTRTNSAPKTPNQGVCLLLHAVVHKKTLRDRLFREVVTGNLTKQAPGNMITAGTECCATFRSEFGRAIIKDLCERLRQFQSVRWEAEELNQPITALLAYLGAPAVTDEMIPAVSAAGLTGREMETATVLGLVFRLSCFGPAGHSHFQSEVLPRLAELGAWKSAAKEAKVYSEAFHTAARSVFAMFLNSPNARARSAVLAWIASGINRNAVRTKVFYQQHGLLSPAGGLEASSADRIFLNPVDGGEESEARTFLSQMTSPATLVSTTRMLTEMIVSILQHNAQATDFDLAGALLMPNMLDLAQDVRWGATRSELAQLQTEKRKDFENTSKEERDATTRGLLLLYTLKYFEVGYLPELQKLKDLRKAVAANPADLYLRGQLFLREALLLDDLFVREALEVWAFVARMLAHDAEHRSEDARVYLESFVVSMLDVFTELGNPGSPSPLFRAHRESLLSLCTNLLDLAVSERSGLRVHHRAGVVRLLHSWIQVGSPAWSADGSLLYDDAKFSKYLYGRLLEFGVQQARASDPDEADPSMGSIQLRSLLAFMWTRPRFQQKRLKSLGRDDGFDKLLLSWCAETSSYVGAAFNSVKAIRQHETNAAALSQRLLVFHKTRAKIFFVDFRNLLTLFVGTSATKPALFEPVLDDLARLVCFALNYLVGPLCEQMVVQCSQELHFSPKLLVSLLGQLCLNLQSPRFCVALGAEEAQSAKILRRAENILSNYCSLSSSLMSLFRALVQRVDVVACKFERRPEFADALLGTVMRDPVMLPASGKIVDRKTITRVLATNPFDPYTKTPLSVDDLVPQPLLKSKLDRFWASLQSE